MKKVLNLGGQYLVDPKHEEALFNASRHCDL